VNFYRAAYFPVAIVTLGMGITASASTFSLQADGAQLDALAAVAGGPVEFNANRTATVNANSVLFGADPASGPRDFFSVQVLDSGEFVQGDDFTFSAAVSFLSVQDTGSAPTNAILALTDGSQFFGGSITNSPLSFNPFFNPTGFLPEATSGSSLGALDNGSAFANVTDSNQLTLQLDVGIDSNGRTTSTFTFVNDNGTDPSGTVVSSSITEDLDVSQGLEFVFASSFGTETFRVDEVDISLIPEPTTAVLVSLGSLMMLRRRSA